jgi:L-lactate dehydrogenase complex protein LldE
VKVALFVPCYVDQLQPRAGLAALELLERHGVRVGYPERQTCCGQPLANAGAWRDAEAVAGHFLRVFDGYDYVVCPSGSCTSMVRHHYPGLVPDSEAARRVRGATYELCEFLVDVLGVRAVDAEFPHRVGLQPACHGLRELRLGVASELAAAPSSKVRDLLLSVRGLELVEPRRTDECCGFGGAFSLIEEAVSVRMGRDRLDDHERAGAEFLVSTDVSCLLHLSGIARREGRGLRTLHVAEVLVGEGWEP